MFHIQAYLTDLGLVPDHCNKANIIIEQVMNFWVPSAYKSDVYTILQSIKYAIALCLRKQCTYLTLKYC